LAFDRFNLSSVTLTSNNFCPCHLSPITCLWQVGRNISGALKNNIKSCEEGNYYETC
jgi:hypothetical protein